MDSFNKKKFRPVSIGEDLHHSLKVYCAGIGEDMQDVADALLRLAMESKKIPILNKTNSKFKH